MKYFLRNKLGEVKDVECENDQEAFEIAQRLNSGQKNICEKFSVDGSKNQSWKAYNERGDLIYRVTVMR